MSCGTIYLRGSDHHTPGQQRKHLSISSTLRILASLWWICILVFLDLSHLAHGLPNIIRIGKLVFSHNHLRRIYLWEGMFMCYIWCSLQDSKIALSVTPLFCEIQFSEVNFLAFIYKAVSWRLLLAHQNLYISCTHSMGVNSWKLILISFYEVISLYRVVRYSSQWLTRTPLGNLLGTRYLGDIWCNIGMVFTVYGSIERMNVKY